MTTVHENKQQDRKERRRRIQQAAREVFVEKGYAKTSIEQIARRASLSVGAIYLYFRSKEDLYISLLEVTLDTLDSEIASAGAQGGLTAAWTRLVQWASEDVESTRMLRLIAQPGIRKQLSDEVSSAISGGLTAVRNQLSRLIRGRIDAGEYRPMDPDTAADILWSLYVGTLHTRDARANLDLPDAPLADTADSVLATFESGLRANSARVNKEAA